MSKKLSGNLVLQESKVSTLRSVDVAEYVEGSDAASPNANNSNSPLCASSDFDPTVEVYGLLAYTLVGALYGPDLWFGWHNLNLIWNPVLNDAPPAARLLIGISKNSLSNLERS